MPLRLPVALHHDALLRRTSSVLKWSGSRLLLIPIEAGRGGVSKLQEATMGTLVFVCPTTGHRVSTGVEVDRSSFKSLPRTKTAIFCPRCRKNHMLSRTWAWLDSNAPEAQAAALKAPSKSPRPKEVCG